MENTTTQKKIVKKIQLALKEAFPFNQIELLEGETLGIIVFTIDNQVFSTGDLKSLIFIDEFMGLVVQVDTFKSKLYFKNY